MIYAIRIGKEWAVKFGITNNLRRRLSGLQNGNPEKLEVVAHQETANDALVEKDVHEMCAPDRLRGEWFKPSAQVLEIIGFIREGVVETRGSQEYCKRILADYERAKLLADLSKAIYLMRCLKVSMDRRERIERKKRHDAKAREDWQRERYLCSGQN